MLNLDELFTDKYTPEERRRLYHKEYFERGLIKCEGSRVDTAEFLGFSIRGLRRVLKEDYPDLDKAYPPWNNGSTQIAYEMQKFALLRSTPYYWRDSKRAEIIKKLKALANALGAIDKSLERDE